ncbi:protein translocase subunit SecF [Candidatus Pacearchaeota archaeon]|nr:protein translocase subunit SecF [Candidatus Pacearchaeota archaeon]
MENEKSQWYDKSYKLLLAPPIIFLIICLVYLGSFYSSHGDFILKDASLSGGTTITLRGDFNAEELELGLKTVFEDVNVRTTSDLATGKHNSIIIDSSVQPDVLEAEIEKIIGAQLTEKDFSTEFSGPALSKNFYRQLITALLISFLLMSFVIFFLFRTFIPSIAVIFSAFADIVMPLAILDYFGVRISAAGIAGFLMLIGYSVDTDILLTTRVLKKREGTVNQRIFSSFKTGIFMTSTALLAVLPAFLIITSLPDSFRQIFLILALGLFADIINTWLTNASVIKWYADKKGIN